MNNEPNLIPPPSDIKDRPRQGDAEARAVRIGPPDWDFFPKPWRELGPVYAVELKRIAAKPKWSSELTVACQFCDWTGYPGALRWHLHSSHKMA